MFHVSLLPFILQQGLLILKFGNVISQILYLLIVRCALSCQRGLGSLELLDLGHNDVV